MCARGAARRPVQQEPLLWLDVYRLGFGALWSHSGPLCGVTLLNPIYPPDYRPGDTIKHTSTHFKHERVILYKY